MKTIKNLMLAAMVLFAGNAMAQSISAAPVTLTDGTGVLDVQFESTEEMTGAQFNLTLPSGISIAYDDEEDDYIYKAQKGYNVNFNDGKDAQTKIVIISRKNKNVAALTSGTTLITITLSATEGATGDATISGITFAKSGASVDGNADFTVAISASTGINALNADDSNEPAFNLAGQKVGKNYKGIIVKNGKKMMK